MLDKKLFEELLASYKNYTKLRDQIIIDSRDILRNSKQAIFALHRDNVAEAKEKLATAENIFTGLGKTYRRESALLDEGSYLAALEEYIEARLMYQFVTLGKIGEVKGIRVNPNVYIAGLCDLPGELYRYAIAAATKHDLKMVKTCAHLSDDIIGELIEFDLTSYLRTKFDQAKQAYQKLEYIVYEVLLKSNE